MRLNALTQLSMVFLGLFLFSAPASANTAIPFLVVGCMYWIWALVPIIIVEAIVLLLFGFSPSLSAGVAVFGNLMSTVVGIPIALLLGSLRASLVNFAQRFNTRRKRVFAAIFVVPFSWLDEADPLTDEDFKALHWVECGALLVLLAFFLLTSWVIETTVALAEAPLWSHPSLAVFVANLVSYGLLLIVLVKWAARDANEFDSTHRHAGQGRPSSTESTAAEGRLGQTRQPRANGPDAESRRVA
jgi:hypothetical protein